MCTFVSEMMYSYADILTHIDIYTQLGMYAREHIHIHIDMYIIHSYMHTTRHGDTNILTKHTYTITIRYAHHVRSHMFIHPYEKLGKQKNIHLYLYSQTDLDTRSVHTHANMEEQSHILTYLYICTRRIDNTFHTHTQTYL